jgi:hypothetical protein
MGLKWLPAYPLVCCNSAAPILAGVLPMIQYPQSVGLSQEYHGDHASARCRSAAPGYDLQYLDLRSIAPPISSGPD